MFVLTLRDIHLTLAPPWRPRGREDWIRAQETDDLSERRDGLLEAIEGAGAEPDQILRLVGLDRAAMSRPDGFIACSDFARMLTEAARATRDDCFGLHFGERYNPKDVGRSRTS